MDSCRQTLTILVATAGLWLAAGSAQAAVDLDELSDISARIQFAVFEADFDTLDRLAARLEDERARGQIEPLLRYQAAYAAYRAAELAPQADQSDSPYLERCEEQALAAAGGAAEAAWEFADALALAGACAALDASRNLTALLSATRARRHLRAARELGPENPRVLLLLAVSRMRQSSLPEAWGTPAALLARAAERFTLTLPPQRGWPDWGEAEAAAIRAELSMAAGEILAARDAAEHALMLAPDYRRARAVLEQLSAAAR